MDEFRQPGKSSEGFSIGSSCDVSRKGAFYQRCVYVFGEVEDTKNAESGSRIRIRAYGNEVQTETESSLQSKNVVK